MEKNPGFLVLKGGSEGVFAATITAWGLGFAVEIDDGAKRAAETAMAALISRFTGANGRAFTGLDSYLVRPVRNAAGDFVGVIRAAKQ